jgi:hypothetical protein
MGLIKNLLGLVSLFGLGAATAPEVQSGPVYGQRPTPRHPERRKSAPVASPQRAKFRKRVRALYLRRLARERAVGVNPKYLNAGYKRGRAEIDAWLKRANEWNKANPAKVAS